MLQLFSQQRRFPDFEPSLEHRDTETQRRRDTKVFIDITELRVSVPLCSFPVQQDIFKNTPKSVTSATLADYQYVDG